MGLCGPTIKKEEFSLFFAAFIEFCFLDFQKNIFMQISYLSIPLIQTEKAFCRIFLESVCGAAHYVSKILFST